MEFWAPICSHDTVRTESTRFQGRPSTEQQNITAEIVIIGIKYVQYFAAFFDTFFSLQKLLFEAKHWRKTNQNAIEMNKV